MIPGMYRGGWHWQGTELWWGTRPMYRDMPPGVHPQINTMFFGGLSAREIFLVAACMK